MANDPNLRRAVVAIGLAGITMRECLGADIEKEFTKDEDEIYEKLKRFFSAAYDHGVEDTKKAAEVPQT